MLNGVSRSHCSCMCTEHCLFFALQLISGCERTVIMNGAVRMHATHALVSVHIRTTTEDGDKTAALLRSNDRRMLQNVYFLLTATVGNMVVN